MKDVIVNEKAPVKAPVVREEFLGNPHIDYKKYMKLLPMDKIEQGDEFWYVLEKRWVMSHSPGSKVGNSHIYRRKN